VSLACITSCHKTFNQFLINNHTIRFRVIWACIIYFHYVLRFADLRHGCAAARLLGLRVRIPPGARMSVSCDCCVLSGRGLCDGINWSFRGVLAIVLCRCVWSWCLVGGGHKPESGWSATVKVLRLYCTRINVMAFSLFIIYYVCSRLTTYCYCCYRVSRKFHVHVSDMGYSESHGEYIVLPIQEMLEVTPQACDMSRVPRELCHTWDFLTSRRVHVLGTSCLPSIAYYCCIIDSVFYS